MTPVNKVFLITPVVAILMLRCPFQVKSQYCTSEAYDGEIRLRDGPTPREGRLDLCFSHSPWYSLCNESTLGVEEFQVICRELGFCTQGGKISSNHYSVPYDSFQARCTGEEEDLYSCFLGYCGYHTSVPGINCSAETPPTPLNVTIQVLDYYTMQMSWSPPIMIDCSDIDEYRINCHDYSLCFDSLPTITTNSTNVTVRDYFFLQHCAYECCVSGYNSAGEGSGNCASRPLPTPPRNVSATPIPSLLTSLLVEWVEPEYIDGTFGWYQVVCGTQTSYSHSVAMTTVEVTGLSMFTTYTCCVSVQNVVYTSAQECVNATTYLEHPTAPMDVNISKVTANSIQLEWTTPQYNGTLSHYTIACKQAQDLVWSNTSTLTSEIVINLRPFTYYMCCVSASNQGGEGNQSCAEARTKSVLQNTAKEDSKQGSLDLVAVVSGGVLFALLVLFVVVTTVISCWCIKKRKQIYKRNQQRSRTRTDEPDKPATNAKAENAYSVHYKPDYKEEVEIRYKRPATKSNATSAAGTKAGEKKKPMIPQKTCEYQNEGTQHNQQATERIYQPLIPPKTYKKPAVSSAYQDLTFGTREQRSEADSSEGQYETVRRPEEVNQYEPLTFGVSTSPQSDGGYQALAKRDESSHYQDLHSIPT